MTALHPVLVGVGQVTQRGTDLATLREPADLIADAASLAFRDTGAAAFAGRIDSVRIVNVICASYPDPAGAVAERLGLAAGERLYTTLGGNTPQWLVNRTADDLAAGRIRAALLAGGEAMHTLRVAGKAAMTLAWSRQHGRPEKIGDARQGSDADEWNHGAQMPAQIYPLFEIAYRAASGRTPAAHESHLANLSAALARVAATHPHAWFRDAKAAHEIGTVTDANRMVAYPYTKYMNAHIAVDQAAAVVMTTDAEARARGIPPSRWVYLHGGAECHDHWFIKDRVGYDASPAMATAFAHALAQAGITARDLGPVDLYSCFPIAVELGARALGFADDGSRALTVTGGLPYFGGPGNDYSMHAIATIVDRLRAQPDAYGFVSALGWYVTKHAAGVYAVRPPHRPWRRDDVAAAQREVDAMPHPECVTTAAGPAHVETYTVVHDRTGAAQMAIVIARLADGRRVLTNTDADPDLFATLEREEMVGAAGRVSTRDDGRNVFRFAGA